MTVGDAREPLCTNKLSNLEEMGKFPDIYNFSRWHQEDM
jgi:hypothetical protein